MIFSTNYFWMRVLATLLIFVTTLIVTALSVIFSSEISGVVIGALYSGVIGAFNVFEPKVVEKNLERWEDIFKRSME